MPVIGLRVTDEMKAALTAAAKADRRKTADWIKLRLEEILTPKHAAPETRPAEKKGKAG